MFKKIKEHFKNYTKRDYLMMFYHFFLVVIGNFLLAFGTAAFLVPYDIITGGISGIAIVLQSVIGGENKIDLYVLILNWVLFFIGLIFLGKKFTLQTLVSVIIYPFALSFIMRVIKPEEWLKFNNIDEFNTLLAAICGSVLVGLGCAITFKGGGSTGGLDILAFIGQKYFKIKCSIGAFVIDALIILCGFLVFRNLTSTVIGIIGAFLCSAMIEKVFIGYSSTFVAQIISDKYEEINDFIINTLGRGSTLLEAEGGYSNEHRKVIMVAFDRKEYTYLIENISKIDPKAFITITLSHEVNGEGFASFPKSKL